MLKEESNLSPIQRRFFQAIYDSHVGGISFDGDAERRAALADRLQDFRNKKATFLSYLDGICAIDFKRPSRLFEVPSYVECLFVQDVVTFYD